MTYLQQGIPSSKVVTYVLG